MARPERFITLAAVGAPHGVRGEVRVKSFTADPLALDTYGPLFAADGRRFEIERLRALKDDMLVVKFRGVDDRDAAARLTNVMVGVGREALPPPDADEFYVTDLIGLAAVDPAGLTLGTIVAVHNHGAGDVLEIARGDGRALLVPFTNEAVPDIDVAGGRVVVSPPAEVEARETDEEEKT